MVRSLFDSGAQQPQRLAATTERFRRGQTGQTELHEFVPQADVVIARRRLTRKELFGVHVGRHQVAEYLA